MEKITIDTGVVEYEVNGTPLRFNPSDYNVYARFFEFYNELDELTKPYADASSAQQDEETGVDEKGFAKTADLLALAKETDGKIKERLAYVFGEGNDFDAMFHGVNVLAANDSGNLIIEDFLNAVMPLIEQNAAKREAVIRGKKEAAVAAAKLNREQRRALAYGKVGTAENG